MPYKLSAPPKRIAKLPKGAQRIFISAYNSAEEQGLPEKNRNRIAWNAVKKKYKQDKDGKWHRKEGKTMEEIKAVSLDAERERILQGWDERSGYVPESPSGYGYIIEIFDAYLIVQDSGAYWRVSYSEGDEGALVFAEKEKWIEMRRRWVRKGGVLIGLWAEDEEALVSVTDTLMKEAEPEVSPISETADEHMAEQLTADEATKGLHGGKSDDETDNAKTVTPGDHCGIPEGMAVKALGQNRVGAYAALWGSPGRKDLVGEYFTPETGEMQNVFEAVGKLPLFYHHGMDQKLKASVVGLVDVLMPDEVGLWYEAELQRADKYRDAIARMIGEGKLGTSTGCLPGHGKAAEDGWLERWCIVDVSMTPTPMEYRMLERPVAELKAVYKDAGLELPEFDADKGKGADDQEARQREIELELELVDLLDLEV